MDRRKFLKATGTLVAATTLARGAAARAAPGSAEGRQVLPLNRNWRYSRTRVEGAQDKGFDDSAFERVVVPHTNVRLPWHSFDEKSYQFVSVYRRRFKLPPRARGQHVFVDFEGVMAASTVWLNGTRLGEYRGGFTPFSFDLTPHLDFAGENVLVVEVDSTERPDIPPFGDQVDYLTFGGIYREVSLRIVAASFLENIFVRPVNVLSSRPALDVDCFVQHLEPGQAPLQLEAELCDDRERVVARASLRIPGPAAGSEPSAHTVRFGTLPAVKLWDLQHPNLYRVRVRLLSEGHLLDQDERRFGFRSARFTDHGFELNGKVIKLRGLNRHQTFPFVGAAMPRRVQRRDAQILRQHLKCNIVRTSHYPQSRHFLDACDELGLLVLEEIPGWQHIGDASWKDLAVDNVRRMIRRDWNHPAIILWGVRINESSDDHDFYARTNATAHQLDPTRQTGGIRAFQESELLEDVFTMNDFGYPLKAPNHPCYLNTEFVGHTYNTKSIDNADRLMEHTLRHARVHDQLASNPQYAGGIAWCAFDYNTHQDFGSGDRICYHGVADIFREAKPAAGFYRSQCDPSEEVVVEPAIHWAPSDEAGGLSKIVVCSNCEQLKLFVGGKLLIEGQPDRAQFPHLPHAPFVFELGESLDKWGDLRIEGYIAGRQVIVKRYSGQGLDRDFAVLPDDAQLVADGADCTRVVLRVTDEFGNVRPFANDAIRLELTGPAELIGDNPFVLVGGVGAIWIRAQERAGVARITASHPLLGQRHVEVEIAAAPPDSV
ncbi:MAG: Beta-galactosidase [Gammaproteobacteria bacterium]|nr:Beta-galactosidase [Gammaproteobacteria bacterium]